MNSPGNKVVCEPFYIEAASRRLYAERLIPASIARSTTLVFLHDAIGSIRQWRGFPEEVAAATGCRGLVYDRYGYGMSEALEESRWPSYLEHEALRSLPDVLKACDIDDLILIGHSDGASIALIFAGRCPPSVRLRGVVSEAAHVFVEDITVAGIKDAIRVAESSDFLQKLAKFHGEKTRSVFDAWHRTWLTAERKHWNMEHYLPSIMCPLLIIQGRDDEYGTVAQVEAIATQSSGKSKTVLIDHCAHVPHYQARELVLREIAQFIATT